MQKILTNKKGVTLLEGLIAMALLALVAAGTFGVLLSVSHKSGRPDIREEMALAVEKANDQLQAYAQNIVDETIFEHNATPLCPGEDLSGNPLSTSGKHSINCLLPVICDTNNGSSFSYTVRSDSLDFKNENGGNNSFILNTNYNNNITNSVKREITFEITCNGFTL